MGGLILLALFVLFGWGIASRIRRHEPGESFWRLVAVVQVTLGIQVIAGLILLALGHTRPLLHYGYGSVFPVVVLVIAHILARELERDQYLVFAIAAFICFGLTLRALETGCGGMTLEFLRACFT
jgi:Na+-driven multidrug efflux pump